jgi:hypothetical protein
MRATVMHGAGDVRIENVPDATLVDPAERLHGPTLMSFCLMFWRAVSNPDVSLIALSAWMKYPRATGPWTNAKRSRSW